MDVFLGVMRDTEFTGAVLQVDSPILKDAAKERLKRNYNRLGHTLSFGKYLQILAK